MCTFTPLEEHLSFLQSVRVENSPQRRTTCALAGKNNSLYPQLDRAARMTVEPMNLRVDRRAKTTPCAREGLRR